jgi:site-specific DNA recombinase
MPNTDGHGPKRVVLYARRSDRKDNFSIAGQLKELRDHAHAEGHEIAEEVHDPWAKRWTLDRPGVGRIRELALLGGVDEVWAWRWDRFGESPWPEVLGLELEEYGVRLRSLDDSGEGEDAELLNGLKGLMAKKERRRIAERSRLGKFQKAHQGKVVASHNPIYGFDFNEARDGYMVDEVKMRTVRRIFEWVGRQHLSITGVVNKLQDEGVRSPSGGVRWDGKTLRSMIMNDAYRPHTKEDLKELGVTSEVLSTLEAGLYGVCWYGKRRVRLKSRTAVDVVHNDPKEWVPIPIVSCGIDQNLIKAARLAVKDNRAASRNTAKFWELSGGVTYCGVCGRRMLPSERKRRASEKRSYFYYICPRGRDSRDEGCNHNRHHPAVALEEQVWEEISSFLLDPERMRQGLEDLVLSESQRDGELEAAFAHWTDMLVKADAKMDRLLDLYLEGHLSKGRYDERVRALEAEAQSARGELEKLRARRQIIAQAQSNIEELVESYAEALPDDLASLTGSERHEVYRILSLRITLDNSGIVEMNGVVTIPQSKDHIETCPET